MPVIELHDLLQPMALPPAASPTCDAFVVSSWMDDEPIEALAAAMPSLTGLRVVISGRPPSEQLRKAVESAGIEVPGFLSDADFRATLAGAGVVVALTTRDGTMQRGGYEAASAGKALVTSDTRVLRDYFGSAAAYAANDAGSIAAAIKDGLANRGQLEAEMRALRDRRLAAQEEGLRQLANVLRRELSAPAA
jgi:glycosyltransferase involved in cell wall biosynthesis